jgi:hypothetical protein
LDVVFPALGNLRVSEGNCKRKCASLAGLARHGDGAAMRLHKRLRDGESESYSTLIIAARLLEINEHVPQI